MAGRRRRWYVRPLAVGTIVGALLFGCRPREEQTKSPPPPPAPAEVPAAALLDSRGMVSYTAADQPQMVPATRTNFLIDTDAVLGAVIDGQARAYPVRFVAWHHAVNDQVGERAFVITLCPVCRSGIRYDRRVDDRVLAFDFFGLYLGALALIDRQTGSVWGQVSGKAVRGELAGKRLKKRPLLETDWREWKRLHPDTVVMAPTAAGEFEYAPPGRAPHDYHHFPQDIFKRTWIRRDLRLQPFELVFGVTVPAPGEDAGKELYCAYPVKAVDQNEDVINDTVGDSEIAVFLLPPTTTTAFFRKVNGRLLTFASAPSADAGAPFRDRETGTRWSIEGRGVSGPLKGARLTPVSSHLSRWYGWSANYPETLVYHSA